MLYGVYPCHSATRRSFCIFKKKVSSGTRVKHLSHPPVSLLLSLPSLGVRARAHAFHVSPPIIRSSSGVSRRSIWDLRDLCHLLSSSLPPFFSPDLYFFFIFIFVPSFVRISLSLYFYFSSCFLILCFSLVLLVFSFSLFLALFIFLLFF